MVGELTVPSAPTLAQFQSDRLPRKGLTTNTYILRQPLRSLPAAICSGRCSTMFGTGEGPGIPPSCSSYAGCPTCLLTAASVPASRGGGRRCARTGTEGVAGADEPVSDRVGETAVRDPA